ncbi:hypothetical protein ABW21_db0209524 [Orbilia brochopaga]|nr:hypothetical protein ABW21_db0209524 [Drechslerella brochopaga]
MSVNLTNCADCTSQSYSSPPIFIPDIYFPLPNITTLHLLKLSTTHATALQTATATAMKPFDFLTSCTSCLPPLTITRQHKPHTEKPHHENSNTNPATSTITMASSKIIPFQIPHGFLEPHETRPIYQLPLLPDMRSARTLGGILRLDRKRKEREKRAIIAIASGQVSNFYSWGGSWRDGGGTFGLAAVGEKIISQVLEEILEERGQELSSVEKETIKETFLTVNQTHYFAVIYHMEQHIHHYGQWATVTPRDLADVFRGYIGGLSSAKEIGVDGIFRWLHKLLDDIVTKEIKYRVWKGKCDKVVNRRGVPGTVVRKGKGKQKENVK